jgi:UDP-N-acetylmuramoyl-tripeptide--D-alanyl-D-alanine ligase
MHFHNAQHFASIDALTAAVTDQLGQVSSILVKGSRFMKMERVSRHIMAFDKKDKKNKEVDHAA